MQSVDAAARSEPYVQARVPLRWLGVFDLLMARPEPTLSLSQVLLLISYQDDHMVSLSS